MAKKVSEKVEVKKGFFAEFVAAIQYYIKTVSKMDFGNAVKSILELLLIVVLIALLQLPFILFRDIIISFVDLFEGMSKGTIVYVITFVFQVFYFIFAVFAFMGLFKKRFGEKISEAE